ncbi:MAG: alpha/beta hydrolase-fold protein [Vulcanimicrobiota bacterium]
MLKYAIGFALCSSLLTVAWGEPPGLTWSALQGDGYTGKLRQAVTDFAGIGPLKISVYLPPHYQPTTRYPVLYVVDGQNLFEGRQGTWMLDETLEELTNSKKMRDIIVVGVHTGLLAKPGNQSFDRMHWFVPRQTFSEDARAWQGGGASQFLDGLLRLKGQIDHDFSTDPKDAGIMGSSLGGIFAEYAGFKRSDLFQQVAIMSPSAWLHNRKQQGSEQWHPAHAPWPRSIWMDMGSHEGDLPDKHGVWQEHPADSDRYSNATLQEAQWINQQPETKVIRFRYTPYDPRPGQADHLPARHNEPSWALRAREALPFLYPPR